VTSTHPGPLSQISFIKGKVDAPEFVAAVAEAKPDAVIHLAGLQMPTCRANPVLGASVNVIGTLNVFEAAKAIKAAGGAPPKIVYASSAAVFGPDAEYGEKAAGDMSTPKPSSHYGAYKLCAEFAAKAYFLTDGIPSVGLRPLTVYGPGRDTGLTSFPTRAIAASVLGKPFEIPFSGATVYIHIREIADIFVQTARNNVVADGKVYTIGGDTVDTATFVAELDKILPGSAAGITVTGGSLPIASKLDDAALRADYPMLLRIPLADGIKETVEVYKVMAGKGTLTI
jgi:nucleoside-diphosphate-sugar epimerase